MSSSIDTAVPPRVPQRQRGRDRVAGLMAAAASLFLEKGYDSTTMTEIASRAGAAIGSLYLFFPTKAAVAQAVATALADTLSTRLDTLRERIAGQSASAIADAVFAELSQFLREHPVYAVMAELPGEEGWRHAVRLRRRGQIAALFAQASPSLPAGQADRLAAIVPHLMAIPLRLGGADEIVTELRQMLQAHLGG